MARRNGFSLIELLVVLAILAVLFALLLPAVQKVRGTAVRMQSISNVRQMLLAVQNFASNYNDQVPSLNGQPRTPNVGRSVHNAVLPYIEQGALYQKFNTELTPSGMHNFRVSVFISPADPSLNSEWWRNHPYAGPTSYAINAYAFLPGSTLAASYRDGLSNTVGLGERYAACGQITFYWYGQPPLGRRASFADNGPILRNAPVDYNVTSADVYPVVQGNPPVAGPSHQIVGPSRPDDPPDRVLKPILTPFQVAPAVIDCHHMIPQTPHESGMIVGLMDGSVRTLAPGISPATFWGAVTPNGGEILAGW